MTGSAHYAEQVKSIKLDINLSLTCVKDSFTQRSKMLAFIQHAKGKTLAFIQHAKGKMLAFIQHAKDFYSLDKGIEQCAHFNKDTHSNGWGKIPTRPSLI